MIRTSWSVILFFIIPIDAFSQVFNDDYFKGKANETLDLIYSMEFEEAEKHILEYKGAYEKHPAPYFFLALNRWWQTYISEKMENYYGFIEENLARAITRNRLYVDKQGFEVEYTFFQFMNLAFSTRLHILREEWFKAAQSGRKALPHLKSGFAFTQDSPEFYFGSGLYHYYAEIYPKEHIYIRPFMIFFPNGDADLGLEELKRAADLPNYTQIEASYYLGEILLDEEKDYQAGIDLTRKLHEQYPSNSWFLVDHARALTLGRQFQKAKPLLDSAISRFSSISNAFSRMVDSRESKYTSQLMMRAYHYYARILYHEGKYPDALEASYQSMALGELSKLETDEHFPANEYIKGLCFDAMGDRGKAVRAYRKALTLELNGWIKQEAKGCLERACLP